MLIDDQKYIVIVSAYGRGGWLAVELAKKNQNVVLLDITKSISHLSADDWVGPFGFFRTERFSREQREFLNNTYSIESVDQGFTVWSKERPVEFKGPLSKSTFSKLNISEDEEEYILRYDSLSKDERKRLYKKTSNKEKSWLSEIADNWSGNEVSCSDKPQPLFTPLFCNSLKERSFSRMHSFCSGYGVKVIESNNLELSFSEDDNGTKYVNKVSFISQLGVENKISCVDLIWTLSSVETTSVFSQFSENIFLETIEPQYVWLKCQLQFEESSLLEVLPRKIMVTETLEGFSSEESYYIVNKFEKEGVLNVWFKALFDQTKNSEYMTEKRKALELCFISRFKGLNHTIEMKGDNSANYAFPIYNELSRKSNLQKNIENLSVSSPENWEGLGLEQQLSYEEKVLDDFKIY